MAISTVPNSALLSEFHMYIKWVALLCTYLYSVLLCVFTYVNNSSDAYMHRGFVKYLARYTRFVVLPVHSLVVIPTLVPASSYVCKVASVFMSPTSFKHVFHACTIVFIMICHEHFAASVAQKCFCMDVPMKRRRIHSFFSCQCQPLCTSGQANMELQQSLISFLTVNLLHG